MLTLRIFIGLLWTTSLFGQFEPGSVTKEQFHQAIREVEQAYQPFFNQRLAMLHLRVDWDAMSATAQSGGEDQFYFLIVNGGLVRNPVMTVDGLTLALCHEMGHIFGGFPWKQDQLAAEGQADYYATQACTHLIWQNQPTLNEQAAALLAPDLKELCHEIWAEEGQRLLCYRSLLATENLARFFEWKNELEEPLDLLTPSAFETDSTLSGYPSYQCRIDTLVAGSLCTEPFSHETTPQTQADLGKSSCTLANGYVAGVRPRCWYKPD